MKPINHIALGGPLSAALGFALTGDPILALAGMAFFYSGIAVQAVHNYRAGMREIELDYQREMREIDREYARERMYRPTSYTTD